MDRGQPLALHEILVRLLDHVCLLGVHVLGVTPAEGGPAFECNAFPALASASFCRATRRAASALALFATFAMSRAKKRPSELVRSKSFVAMAKIKRAA
ncbi:hypothetical protein [Streptomyces sp. WMMC940]|uniref:hypothetical protein n=1 Tax=Streptomyces sp. WMMC940 TaxID=3015153 RepID=UPI0022B650E3|nr:hypothetical protein [Streptomyces sp. WMMC940]MCZ7459789.1 hypothetical protein [Streptomyces sp. WMMC940]